MTVFQELSAGVIPYQWVGDGVPHYLVLHSATVRNPRARWEFPKGGIEAGESPRQTAEREFHEETGLIDCTFRDDFVRSLAYTYIRRGIKVLKSVTYFLVEVHDATPLSCSAEHIADPGGHWYHWGTFDQVSQYLYHAKIRQLFAEADMWVRNTAPVQTNPGRQSAN